MKALTIGIAFALLGATPPAYVAGLGEQDALGRPLAEVFTRGVPVMVLYANRQTEDSTKAPATDLAVRVAKDVPFVSLVRIDLRGVPGFTHGIAHGIIRGQHEKSLRRYDEERKKLGIAAMSPADAARTLYLVPDDEGRSHQAVGLAKGFETGFAIVYGPDGTELTRGPFPDDAKKIEAALRGCAKAK